MRASESDFFTLKSKKVVIKFSKSHKKKNYLKCFWHLRQPLADERKKGISMICTYN